MELPRLRQLAQDKFLKGSALIFGAVIMANICNYLYQILMGRLLTIGEFGEVNSIISFVTILSLPLGALTNYFAHTTSTYMAEGRLPIIRNLHRKGLRKTFWIALALSLVLLMFSPIIASYLDLELNKLFFVVFIFITTALGATNTGFVQGLQNFINLSKLNIYASGLKLILSVILVWIGWKVYGALAGLVLSLFLSFIYSQLMINRELPKSQEFLRCGYLKSMPLLERSFWPMLFLLSSPRLI